MAIPPFVNIYSITVPEELGNIFPKNKTLRYGYSSEFERDDCQIAVFVLTKRAYSRKLYKYSIVKIGVFRNMLRGSAFEKGDLRAGMISGTGTAI